MSTILTYVALICLLVLLLIYLNGWNINSVIKEGLNDEASSFVVTMTNNDSGSVSSSDIFDNAKKDGAKVGYTFNQALLDYDCFAMPKGAPNKETAMKFLAEISKAEYQANLPFHITYGPTNKKAYEVTTAPKELLEALPSHPKNVPLMMPVSLDWYANHRAEALELYMELLSE